jgi:Zinc knuckle
MNKRQHGKRKEFTSKVLLPQKKRDPNAIDVDRLSTNEHTRLMREGRCFKCKNTGHQANECPKNNDHKKKYKEELKKKMNRRELHAHVWALFKDMMEEDKEEFMKGAEEAGF